MTLSAMLGLSLALSGCLQSSFNYYSHRASDKVQVYFKVPAHWTVFSEKQLIEAVNGPLSQTQMNQIVAGQWETSFSNSPRASPKTPLDNSSNYPNGLVFARQLSQTDRDGLSYAALRQTILGADPLAAPSSPTAVSPFNVLSYTEFTRPGGIRGSKLVTNITQPNGTIDTFGQVIAVDSNSDWVFGMGVACKVSCWGTNSGLINQILNSWDVKEQSQ